MATLKRSGLVERSVCDLPHDVDAACRYSLQDGINNDALLIDDCNGNPAPHHWCPPTTPPPPLARAMVHRISVRPQLVAS